MRKKVLLSILVVCSGAALAFAILTNVQLFGSDGAVGGKQVPTEWDLAVSIVLCLLIAGMVILILRKIDLISAMLGEIWHNRQLIFRLSRNDFKTRYAGSFMGIFWAFVQPIITVLIYWLVFEKGFRAGTQSVRGLTVPFVLYLISGMVPWFFFSDAWPNGTSCLTSYSYLVKKVVFRISVLPIVKVTASVYVHLFFIALTMIIFAGYGYLPDLYTLQVIYYSFAAFMLALGLSYLTSAIVVFFRDLQEIVNILLQVLVWGTPIMWNIESTVSSDALRILFKMNPMYYVVSGYRDALINKIWFWENPNETAYFWFVTLMILGAGFLVFRRLKPHFADVI